MVNRVVPSECEVWYGVPQYRTTLEDLDDSARWSTQGLVAGDFFDVGFWEEICVEVQVEQVEGGLSRGLGWFVAVPCIVLSA